QNGRRADAKTSGEYGSGKNARRRPSGCGQGRPSGSERRGKCNLHCAMTAVGRTRSTAARETFRRNEVRVLSRLLFIRRRWVAALGAAGADLALSTEERLHDLPDDQRNARNRERNDQNMLCPDRHL